MPCSNCYYSSVSLANGSRFSKDFYNYTVPDNRTNVWLCQSFEEYTHREGDSKAKLVLFGAIARHQFSNFNPITVLITSKNVGSSAVYLTANVRTIRTNYSGSAVCLQRLKRFSSILVRVISTAYRQIHTHSERIVPTTVRRHKFGLFCPFLAGLIKDKDISRSSSLPSFWILSHSTNNRYITVVLR